MRQKKIDSKDFELDSGALLYALWRKAWVIILIAALFAAGGRIVAKNFMEEEYHSTTKAIVLFKDTSEYANVQSDFQTGAMLAGDFREIIRSVSVMQEVIDYVGVTMTPQALASKTEIWIPTDTRILSITVTADDPYVAQQLADKIMEVSSKYIVELMKIDAVNVIDKASLITTPSAPDANQVTLVGAVIGVVLACILVLAKYLLDDTIIVPDDVDMYLDINVLGVIPFDDGTEKKKKHKKKRKSLLKHNK